MRRAKFIVGRCEISAAGCHRSHPYPILAKRGRYIGPSRNSCASEEVFDDPVTPKPCQQCAPDALRTYTTAHGCSSSGQVIMLGTVWSSVAASSSGASSSSSSNILVNSEPGSVFHHTRRPKGLPRYQTFSEVYGSAQSATLAMGVLRIRETLNFTHQVQTRQTGHANPAVDRPRCRSILGQRHKLYPFPRLPPVRDEK